MLGAALSWLSQASDTRRINVVLGPLAGALSPPTGAAGRDPSLHHHQQQQQQRQQSREGEGSSMEDAERVLRALRPALESVPSGSANLALLRVHRLLHDRGAEPSEAAGGSGGSGGAGRDSTAGAAAAAAGQGPGRLAAVVGELRRLPAALRDACLPLVRTQHHMPLHLCCLE